MKTKIIHHVRESHKKLKSHLHKHHKKYIFWALWILGMFKGVLLLLASFGFYQYWVSHITSANYTEIVFGEITWANLWEEYVSEEIVLEWIWTGWIEIEIFNGLYSVDQWEWTNTWIVVYDQQTIKVKLLSATWYEEATESIIYLWGYQTIFKITTKEEPFVEDISVENIDFGLVTWVELNTFYESDIFPVLWINTGVEISITGGEYSINWWVWTTETGLIFEQDAIQQRLLSSENYLEQKFSYLKIWTGEFVFGVETMHSTWVVDSGDDSSSNSGNTIVLSGESLSWDNSTNSWYILVTIWENDINSWNGSTWDIEQTTWDNIENTNQESSDLVLWNLITGFVVFTQDDILEDWSFGKLLTFQFETTQEIDIQNVKINWLESDLRSKASLIYIYEKRLDKTIPNAELFYEIYSESWNTLTWKIELLEDLPTVSLLNFEIEGTRTGISINYESSDYTNYNLQITGENYTWLVLGENFLSGGQITLTGDFSGELYEFNFVLEDFWGTKKLYTGDIAFNKKWKLYSSLKISDWNLTWESLTWHNFGVWDWLKGEFDVYNKCVEKVSYKNMDFKVNWVDLSMKFPDYEIGYIQKIVLFFVDTMAKNLDNRSDISPEELKNIIKKMETVLFVVKLERDSKEECWYRLWNYYISSFKNALKRNWIFVNSDPIE